ncbi:MAG: hypothetical protein IJ025_06755 [Clostridia bacterium]|nr:hypothetical protein [Clostridia bacterium]
MKRRYKKAVVFLVSVWLLFFCSLNVQALESNIDQYNEEFDLDSVISATDESTLEILREIGVDELSYESLFSISPVKVFTALFNILSRAIKAPLKFLMITVGVLILLSFMSSFFDSSESVSLVGCSVIVLSAAVPVAEMVTSAFSVLEALSAFTTTFAGVFCAVVSSSGNVSTGAAYSAMTVFSNTLFSGLLSEFCQPVVNVMCSLSFLSCFDFYNFSTGFSATVKKIYVFFMSFAGTVFSGLVTVKGVLSDGADTVTAKGIRFVVGRSLPVVGGTVSETYSALVSSLSIIKNTVGMFGIITVIVTVLPTLIELLIWILAVDIAVIISGSFGVAKAESMLCVLKDTLILLVATVVMVAAIFIVSVGVVIAVKGGGV